MRTSVFRLFVFAFIAMLLIHSSASAETERLSFDQTSAVILVYNRIGEDSYPNTSIRLDQFKDHIQELISGEYNVLPLSEVVKAIRQNKPLPDKTISLTFDGSYESVLQHAVTLLEEHHLPFTLFVPTDHADAGTTAHISWKDLKKLSRKSYVSFGIHPARYSRLAADDDSVIRQQVNKAISRFEKEMGGRPAFFSYPFGEYSLTYKDIISDSGFDAGFTQNSGAAYIDSDLYALPRFVMTEEFGDIERFRMITRSLPLPADDVTPEDPYMTSQPSSSIGFTLPDIFSDKLGKLSCFLTGQGRLEIEKAGQSRVQLPIDVSLLSDQRIRLNCTLPETSDDQTTWRWFGMLMVTSGSE